MAYKKKLVKVGIEISFEDHKLLKTLASIKGKSMHEIISGWIQEKLWIEDAPNATTQKAIDRIEKGQSLVENKDAQDMFRKLGI